MKNSVTSRSVKLLSFIATFVVAVFVSSCSESDDVPNNTSSRVPYQCVSCVKTSDALPENDSNSKGIYKGVFANGTFELDIRNNSEEIKGTVFFNSKKIDMYELSSGYVKGELRAVLRGVLDGKKFSMTFLVNEDGSNPKVYDFSLPNGLPISAEVIKETSNSLYESFEGKYYVKMVTYDNGMPNYQDKVDNPFPPTENVVNRGSIRLLISRNNAQWFSYTMTNGSQAIGDFGSIVDGKLVSDSTHKTIAALVSDELNNVDKSLGNLPLYMYSIRVR
jgi:hypothetical protein